jgi:hypothetical protein
VQVTPESALAWGEKLDLCPVSLYLRLTGIQPEKMFPAFLPIAPLE